MEIKLSDGYYLCGDEFCLWIMRKRTSQKGNERDEKVAGYSPNLQALMENFVDKRLRDTESTTAKECIKEITSKEVELRKFIKETINEYSDFNRKNDKQPRTKGNNKRK